MRVIVYCNNCGPATEDGEHEPIEMEPRGPLYTNEFKTQIQEYKCPSCTVATTLSVNTTLPQDEESSSITPDGWVINKKRGD